MRLKTSGLMCAHDVLASLLTVMWFSPKKTLPTPSTFSSFDASWDGWGAARVERGERYSMYGEGKFSGKTLWLGLNLSA